MSGPGKSISRASSSPSVFINNILYHPNESTPSTSAGGTRMQPGIQRGCPGPPSAGLKPFPKSCALARSLSLFSLPSPASPLTPPLPTQQLFSSSRNNSTKSFQVLRNFVKYWLPLQPPRPMLLSFPHAAARWQCTAEHYALGLCPASQRGLQDGFLVCIAH